MLLLWLSQQVFIKKNVIILIKLMFGHRLQRVAFFFSKNYTSQFKVRSRLADFFKHIHPDQMAQAPTKIKQQNLRSLKNFNSYLDSINQQKPIEGKLLKFYISEKTNNKSRKFFSFNLQLPQLNSEQVKLDQQKAQKFIDDIVNALNHKFKESRSILQGKKKDKIVIEDEIKLETQEEKLEKLQETVGPYHKSQYKQYIQEQSLKNAINAKYMQAEKENLKLQLRKNMKFANTSTNKPMMWSRIISNESGIYNDYQEILNHLIDPKLIYFNEDIGLREIQIFKKKLLPGELDRMQVRETQSILQVCEEMEAVSPPICLFVTTHYSASQIPGFFSIPYNFRPVQLFEQFKACKAQILSERQKYENFYDSYQELSKDLLKKNNFKIKDLPFKNNSDVSSKILILKRLEKYELRQVIEVNIFEAEDYRILCQEYQLDNKKSVTIVKNKIFLENNFKEEDLNKAIEHLNEKFQKKQNEGSIQGQS